MSSITEFAQGSIVSRPNTRRNLSACCRALGIASPAREYATCRRILFRHGAGSAVDRIRRLYSEELKASEEASAALDYLNKRRGNMRYGWLHRNGYCISSSHVKAGARILVARRCKQAGIHWRHHNAACVCAIIARLRSAARGPPRWTPTFSTI